jgi:amidase
MKSSPPTISAMGSRRDFVSRFSRGSLGALASALPLAAISATKASAAYATSSDTTDDVLFMSATKLAQSIRDKKISATEAVQAFIKRQERINQMMNAVVMNCYERALSEAKAADEALAKGNIMGPLHGVPMTIKDSLDTEGVITTGATYGRQQYIPKKDATVVARVRKAGAILLGKTNTPEFTLGGLPGISTASNLLYGSSHNPYDLTRSTSGSSGGAGAVVAAGLASFDIGSDWGGSIRGPSHNNGVSGIKPTSVRVPRTGHIVDYGGIFDLWQQIGPLARRVEDLALITPIIAGPDFRDASCAPVPWADPAAVKLSTLKVAFAVDNGGAGTDDDTRNTVAQAAKWLEGAVASVAEDHPKEALAQITAARRVLSTGDNGAFYQRMADKWGTKNISPQRSESMRTSVALSTPEMVEGWESQDDAKSKMLDWMKSYDVFLCPVAGKPAQPIDVARSATGRGGGEGGGGWPYTGVFNCTGWPVVVVRCGSSADGKLPIGVQVVAPLEAAADLTHGTRAARANSWSPERCAPRCTALSCLADILSLEGQD